MLGSEGDPVRPEDKEQRGHLAPAWEARTGAFIPGIKKAGQEPPGSRRYRMEALLKPADAHSGSGK